MALKIRLARGGAKNRPFYRIVVSDSRNPRDGSFKEKVGSYNPLLPKDSAERVILDKERIQHWLDLGARPTDRVLRFLANEGMMERPARMNPEKAKPKAKAQEREEMRKQKEEEAKEAAAAAAAAPAEEAPAEDAPAEDAPAEDAPAEDAAAEEEKAEG